MGEYAKRKSDNVEIKMGTCASMYYMRYSDRDKVVPGSYSLNPATEKNLFWRIPFPDEDDVKVGEYKKHDRGELLVWIDPDDGYPEKFRDPETVEYPGSVQLKHDCGYLVNMPCYHGEKLPEGTKNINIHWNGKNSSYELVHIKNTEDGFFPIVKCRHCWEMWRYDWHTILPYIRNQELRKRLKQYAPEEEK